MKRITSKNLKRTRRAKRNRAKIFGTATMPRLSVYRSNTYTYAQLINDESGNTIASASTRELKGKGTKTAQAKLLGELLGERAMQAGVKKAVFNKGPYLYHGRVAAVAEGARSKGLQL